MNDKTEQTLRAIRSAWGVDLPHAYRDFISRHFDQISLWNLRWLPLEEIASFETLDIDLRSVLPFAQSNDGGTWGWCIDPERGLVGDVARAYVDDEFAYPIAEDFDDALLVLACGELSGTMLGGRESLSVQQTQERLLRLVHASRSPHAATVESRLRQVFAAPARFDDSSMISWLTDTAAKALSADLIKPRQRLPWRRVRADG